MICAFYLDIYFLGCTKTFLYSKLFVQPKHTYFTPLLLQRVEVSVDSKIENFVMIECSKSFVKMFYMNKKK